jgi:hypothetical protein
VLRVSAQYRLWRLGIAKPAIFSDAAHWRLPVAAADAGAVATALEPEAACRR